MAQVLRRRNAILAAAVAATMLALPFAAQAQPLDGGDMRAAAKRAAKEPIDQLTRDVEHAHPVAMMLLAKRLFDDGRRDEAVFWFYEAQIRWRAWLTYRPNNREGEEFGQLFETVGPDINFYAFCDVAKWHKTAEQVLAWDTAHPDDFTPAGPAKDQQRQGMQGLGEDIDADRDKIKKAHEGAAACGPVVKATAADPYPGEGGAIFGLPDAMVTNYDAGKFSRFKVGSTTKADVVKALGKPEMWGAEPDGTSSLTYTYHRPSPAMAMIGMVRRVIVSLEFDAAHKLSKVNLPSDKEP